MALQFNEPDVDSLREQISYKQFLKWQIYYNKNPFGDLRADYRNAITSCILANANRGKNQRAFKIEEFLVVKPKKQKQTADEMWNLLMSIAGKK